MSIWKWAEWIHPVPEGSRISLGEGNTPLVRSQRIGPRAGLDNLWFKAEGANPSGSYKDRFAAVAVSKMVADGKRFLPGDVQRQYGRRLGSLLRACRNHVPYCPCGGRAETQALADASLRRGASQEREGADCAVPVTSTTTISELQVASPVDGDMVIAMCRHSGGNGHLVEDEEVYRVQRRLAREEGVLCEPAAAVSVAAALLACRQGDIDEHATVVCLLVGSGFKDSPSLARMAGADCPVAALVDLNW